ncbi:T6SS immunity protein Tdi1 domain-containing protein [Adlercreutzia sp. R25]|uniref:T6SS immunity protein Tdi1 domain-containing protein n=1 Tax=Adlercreutzia shanghongiae TaxID=3111773 RepID=UPI002DBF40A9|nr:T6SS immunity protein Tdi1 domain-containing protein [Adlercreutzia sp. R25]MEC4272402.1 T6SS immunity protein Tdi1 domain-containing protein [Adlercreutzia sp. R25]
MFWNRKKKEQQQAVQPEVAGAQPLPAESPFAPFLRSFGYEVADAPASADPYAELVDTLGGRSFGDGLFTVFRRDELPKWRELIGAFYTDYRGEFSPVGYNWLGQCYVLDAQGSVDILEPEASSTSCTDMGLVEFLNVDGVGNRDNAFLEAGYEEWLSGHDPVAGGNCVGYTVPLFLGGKDEGDNMDIVDMEVYWGMTGQLWEAVKDLPEGTKIGNISFE